ncbi:MAG: ABC transporter substrate-binding protein [Rhodospirillaceae bacterium]|jgi:branched-chain amino acid transport system substrate-binding protein|nr:ABC transporter substrate-binding protein [Rhodospirillaceae bacterium]MBT7955754.1 ABC transporter substrate-binding protein [Rhodospirillaceae bacterium]
MFKKTILAAPLAALLAVPNAQAAESIKVGIVLTLTTPASIMGKNMKAAYEVAYDHLGGKIAGKKLELIFEDDGLKPNIGKQKTEKLVKKDKVDFLTGYIWSHVLGASAPVALKAGKIFVSANAGHSLYAGKKCHKNFFNAAWENSQNPMAMGSLLNQRGVKNLYVLSLNYAAGKQMVAGVERTFKGNIVGKDLVPTSHKDWSAEIAKVKAAKPDGVFVFYPGAWGPAFFTQYKQAGLDKTTPLYSVFSVDGANLPVFQKRKMNHLLGTFNTMFWAPDLDNATNKRFVADFAKKYKGQTPSHYAAQAYDSLMLIAAGVRAAGGDAKNTDAVRKGMEKADFPSVRGKIKFGKNHFPIQNFYSRQVVNKGGKWQLSIRETVVENHAPVMSGECKL